MDKLRIQCHSLAQDLYKQQLWEESDPGEIAAVIKVILGHVGDVAFTKTGTLWKKHRNRILKLIEDGRRCYLLVVEMNVDHGWQLSPKLLTALASEVFHHFRAVLRSRNYPPENDADLRDVISNYYSDSDTVHQLFSSTHQQYNQTSQEWNMYLQRVAIEEYNIDHDQAEDFIAEVWPYVLRNLEHYHYKSSLRTQMYSVISRYHQDSQAVKNFQAVHLEIVQHLIDDCFPNDMPINRFRAQRLQDLCQSANIPPDVVNVLQYIASCSVRLFAEDPKRLSLRASEDIYNGIGKFYFGARFTTWITSVILNSRKHILRDMDREPDPLPIDDGEDDDPYGRRPSIPSPMDEELHFLHDNIKEAIRQACQRMHGKKIPHWKKEWIAELWFIEGEDYETISNIIGVNKNTAMTVVARIKPHLQDSPLLADFLPMLTVSLQRLEGEREEVVPPYYPTRPGEELQYRIMLANTGAVDARNVVLLHSRRRVVHHTQFGDHTYSRSRGTL